MGTYLGGLLAQAGLNFAVLDRRGWPAEHSRAIGIHPRALRGFDRLGLTSQLLAAGVTIRRGLLLGGGGQVLGELGFETADEQHPYVLSLPQVETERLLAARLEALAPGRLRRSVRVQAVQPAGDHVRVMLERDGLTETWPARYVVAADGWRSGVRRAAGISFPGSVYPDKYLMGDFPDTTPFGTQAMISLTAAGVTECFPLPSGQRRWVVHTGTQLLDAAGPDALTHIIQERTGLPVPAGECRMFSAFEVRRHLAGRMWQGRLCLIGDAAHVVSPIGGQGMNLGWLDADALAPLLIRAVQQGGVPQIQWQGWERQRRRSAWIAARQAEANMAAGRPASTATQHVREALLTQLLRPPAAGLLADAFTMRWL